MNVSPIHRKLNVIFPCNYEATSFNFALSTAASSILFGQSCQSSVVLMVMLCSSWWPILVAEVDRFCQILVQKLLISEVWSTGPSEMMKAKSQ